MSTATQTKSKGEEYLGNKGFRRVKNDRAWDWVREIADNVRKSMQGPAVILPMINDDPLCAKVAANNELPNLTHLVERLARDTADYRKRFDRIFNKHSQVRGSSISPDDLMKSIGVSQEYTQFVSSWESVIMPTILEILEIFGRAGMDTSSIYAASNMQLVYSMINQTPSADAE